ncbi:MAG: hypothetical protein JWM04_848, partial [Verrucomicrobiales bacterium]|nr:hypothetical protein [Verrucomicrobiales bacterium]
QFGLQTKETAVGLEIWIPFRDQEQTRKSGGELALGSIELFQVFGIVGSRVWIDIDLTDRGTGFGDFCESAFLKVGSTGDGGDEVGYQIRTPLVDILNLSPGLVDVLFGFYQAIVAVASPEKEEAQQNEKPDADNSKFFHTL